MTKVYIDGCEGTTGLRIHERLAGRSDIELLHIDHTLRKDLCERARLLNSCDIAFLCLPDAAAQEAVSLIENEHVRVIDTSTAHRTLSTWAYGFAELSPAHRGAIATGKRIANPGCHATGFISIIYPLVSAGLIARDARLSCFSLTGYSGGGKRMIAQYESDSRDATLCSPRPYGLTQRHKHLPEMQSVCGLLHAPLFTPIVADFYAGMLVGIPLPAELLNCAHALADVHSCLSDSYAGQKLVHTLPLSTQDGVFLAANGMAGKDDLALIVSGNDERVTVFAQFDNLGKGASGAAIQSLNLMTGAGETTGLNL